MCSTEQKKVIKTRDDLDSDKAEEATVDIEEEG
jgi:hypothetical protein